jgi:pimeloyl-ACP methyl ester carboxylesterase
MTAAPANGITIEYDVHGDDDGEPMLLVMGLGGQLIGWPLDFVERLVARGYRVVRYDNRDIGLSTKIDAPVPTRRRVVLAAINRRFAKPAYLLADMADDAAGLLDHLQIESAHVVGISMGGMIGQTLAFRHPRRVRSLTSIMSNTGDRKNGRAHRTILRKLPRLAARDPKDAVPNGVEAFRLISGPHFDEDEARKLVEEAYERSFEPDGAARQTMAAIGSPDRTADLALVTAPTLVVHGLLDRLVKPSGGVATARAIPGARLVMYPDMAHDLPKPRWDELIDQISVNTHRARRGETAAEPATVS